MKLRVVGREKVQVPAGEFEATKVEAESTWSSPIGGAKEIQLTFWYAPKIGRTVKMPRVIKDWASRTGNDEVDEYMLASYSER